MLPDWTTYPMSHEYVAVEPYVVVGTFTVPFAGAERLPQSTGAQDGSEPLHVPSAWQVREPLPTSS